MLQAHRPSRRVIAMAIAGLLLIAVGYLWLQNKKADTQLPAEGKVSPAEGKVSPVGAAPSKPVADGASAKPAEGGAKPSEAAAKPAGVPPPGGPPTVPVKAVQVKVGVVINDVSAVGTLLANEAVTIRPEIDGLIRSIHFEEGQAVSAGARLITIDPAEFRARLAQADAGVSLDKQRLQRAKDLYSKKFISEQALDEAQGNLARSVAQREEAAARLSKAVITAPFAGTVGMRSISPGQYVKAGDNIVRIENISTIKLDFKVPEVYLSRIKRDQEVQVRVDAYPADTFSGRIYAIQPGLDEQTRAVWLRANVPNTDAKLRPGMFARVSLVLERQDDAIVIPEQAIVPKGNDALVLKVVNDKAEIVKVKLGTRRPGEVQVLEGLVANDVVVTDGQLKLMMMPGAKVMILPAAAPAAAAGAAPAAGSASPAQPAKPNGAKS